MRYPIGYSTSRPTLSAYERGPEVAVAGDLRASPGCGRHGLGGPAELLRGARRVAGLSQAELAERGRIVLREGGPDDVLRYVDGVLLVDIWDELVLPGYVRLAWDPLIRTGDRRCDDWCRVVRFGSALTEFQVEVAQAFFALRASDGFLLAGEQRCSHSS
jgi:hypothetical protein